MEHKCPKEEETNSAGVICTESNNNRMIICKVGLALHLDIIKDVIFVTWICKNIRITKKNETKDLRLVTFTRIFETI